MLRKIRVGKRLILGFGLLVLLSVLVGGTALFRMYEIKINLNNISERRLPAAIFVGDMNRDLLLVRVYTLNIMMAGSIDDKNKYQRELDAAKVNYNKASDAAEEFHKTPAGRAAFEKVLSAKSEYDIQHQNLLTVINSSSDDNQVAAARASFNDAADKITNALSDLSAYQTATGKKQAQMAEASMTQAEIIVISSVVFAAVLGGILAVLFSNSLVRPIRDAVGASKRIADGDLSVHFDDQAPDEAGELIRSMNRMQQQLHHTIEGILDSAKQLTTTSLKLNDITDSSNKAVQQQNSELDMAVTAVNELTSAVEEVARNAAATSANSNQADERASDGKMQVGSTVSAIQKLEHELQESKACISSLSNQIANIGSVMDVIRGIADQTNLLALNAAIEAARAGESGRGFAVVADEVRALAHRTQESTKQIENTIKSVEVETEKTVSVMESSAKLATETLNLATNSGSAIEQITDSIGKISDQNMTIANAAEEQATVAREVDKNLLNIKELSEKTAYAANDTRRTSEDLALLAENLNMLVTKFKI